MKDGAFGMPLRGAIAAALLLAAAPAGGESAAPAAPAYADLADLALAAPVVAKVRIGKAVRLDADESPGLDPGRERFYIEAETVALLRGAGGLPGRVRYLADIPRGPEGKAPKPGKKSDYLLFAAPVRGREGELRLVSPRAHLRWEQRREATVRGILQAALAADAPPVVTGVASAFRSPGALPGESDTQIFLATREGRPVSITVARRAGLPPRWSLALGELTEGVAPPPVRDTLLWYRLACALPPELPPASLAAADPDEAAAIAADYRLVLDWLDPCARNWDD
ncbi:MAG: hypothetical protein ACFBQW_04630 [Sphingomonadaceae bacterium]